MKTGQQLQLLLLSAVWGVSFLLIRIAGDSFPPLWVALLRCSAGALLLWIVMAVGGRSLPPRRLLPWLLLVAMFNNAIPFTFFAWGERTIPSSTAAVVNATTPIWTLLISLAVQRGHVTGRMVVGVLLSFAGVVLVVLGGMHFFNMRNIANMRSKAKHDASLPPSVAVMVQNPAGDCG